MQEKCGRYLIGEPLGSGSFGTVYKGWDPDLQRVVALKIFSRETRENSNLSATLTGIYQNIFAAPGFPFPPAGPRRFVLGERRSECVFDQALVLFFENDGTYVWRSRITNVNNKDPPIRMRT